MIKNRKAWEKFEIDLLRSQKVDYEENFRIFTELYHLARSLNKFNFEPLEDIEVDIKYALAINGVKRKWSRKNS
jgi:hypothetical protein